MQIQELDCTIRSAGLVAFRLRQMLEHEDGNCAVNQNHGEVNSNTLQVASQNRH